MRSEAELQTAHDTLATLIKHAGCTVHMPDEIEDQVRICLDMLCWMLEHEDPETNFAVNLRHVTEMLDAVNRDHVH